MERAGSVDPGLPLVTMGGATTALPVGGVLLCPLLSSIAGIVFMIIALGLELGVLYEHRIKDFKAVTDGSAFLHNGSQCLYAATKADLDAYYAESVSDCTSADYKKNLGFLLAASVHALKASGGTVSFNAARSAFGVPGVPTAKVLDTQAVNELQQVNTALTPPYYTMTCEAIYPGVSRTNCIAAAKAAAVLAADVKQDAAERAKQVNIDAAVDAGIAAAVAAGGDAAVVTSLATASPYETEFTNAYEAELDAKVALLAAVTATDDGVGQAAAEAVDADPTGSGCPETIDDYPYNTKADENFKDVIDCTASTDAATVAAPDNRELYLLYLQCVASAGLGNVPPIATADNLAPVPTASRGGTLDVPLFRHSSEEGKECWGYVDPVYTPPPFPANFTCTDATREQRATVMYGMRLGWSLFATVPCVILIIYLAADAALLAWCLLTRRWALAEQSEDRGPTGEVVTSLATMQEMRDARAGLSVIGFIIVVALKIAYDFAPWVTGTILPRATECDQVGRYTDQDSAVQHIIVLIFILATIILLPVSQWSMFTSVFAGENEGAAKARIGEDTSYLIAAGARTRLGFFVLFVVLAGMVMVALEASDGVTWGIAYAQRQLGTTLNNTNDLSINEASVLVEEAATSAVLVSITAGSVIALAYGRWLFTSYGKTNLLTWFVWGGAVIAALLPIFILFGIKFTVDPAQQAVLEKCSQLDIDSFESFVCENRELVFSFALIILFGVFAIMWCCWLWKLAPEICSSDDSSEPNDAALNAVKPSKPARSVAGKKSVPVRAPFQSESIPLLSLRVRK